MKLLVKESPIFFSCVLYKASNAEKGLVAERQPKEMTKGYILDGIESTRSDFGWYMNYHPLAVSWLQIIINSSCTY